MTRKTAITILIVVAILAGLFVGYLIISSGAEKNTSGAINTTGSDGTDFTLPISNTTTDGQNNSDQNQTNTATGPVVVPKLRQITASPVSGFITFERKVETTEENVPESIKNQTQTIYRYVDRATGNVFETNENSLKITRVTNTTVPKVYEAEFFYDGSGVVLRYLDEEENIETYIARVISNQDETSAAGGETQISSLQGIFLPKNVVAITRDPISNKFFYTKDGKGYTFDGESAQNQTLILDYAVTQWLASWVDKQIILTTKPSYFSEGLAFTLNSTTGGQPSKILDDKLGLLVNINSNNTKILTSEYSNGSIVTSVYDVKTDETKTLEIKTLADKCVWGRKNVNVAYCAVPQNLKSGKYPDDWYLGLISFTDAIYKIDLDTNVTEKFDTLSSEKQFDIKDLQISDQEEYLIFQNKKDLSLWSLDITK